MVTFINKLDVTTFRNLATDIGFQFARYEPHSFSGSQSRQAIGRVLMNMPLVGEYFVSFAIIELLRPA